MTIEQRRFSNATSKYIMEYSKRADSANKIKEQVHNPRICSNQSTEATILLAADSPANLWHLLNIRFLKIIIMVTLPAIQNVDFHRNRSEIGVPLLVGSASLCGPQVPVSVRGMIISEAEVEVEAEAEM